MALLFPPPTSPFCSFILSLLPALMTLPLLISFLSLTFFYLQLDLIKMRASPFPGFLENSCKKQKETLQQALGSREGGGLQCQVLASQPIIFRVFQVDRVPGA